MIAGWSPASGGSSSSPANGGGRSLVEVWLLVMGILGKHYWRERKNKIANVIKSEGKNEREFEAV
jgi:hypothetical protein